MSGLTGVWLRVAEGVGDAGGFFGAAEAGAPAFSGEAQSAWSTCPPERQIASSASRAAMYF